MVKEKTCADGVRNTCKICKSNINSKYKKENKASVNKRKRERYHNDEIYRLQNNIRKTLLKDKRNKKTELILCCTFEFFKLYIESKFLPWMNWANRGLYNGEPNYGWDLDHIIPVSTANNVEDIIKLNHYTNFQPLCSKINRYEKNK